ncbi:hypothetical protein [Methylomonas sp. MgM2]
MKRNSEHSDDDDDILNELDRFVIEAIDTLIATSKQVKTVRQRQRKERQEKPNELISAKVTPLKPRPPATSDTGRGTAGKAAVAKKASFDADDDAAFDADDLSGMSSRQRERADAFASWLMQQDNYPIILQHIEELLAPFDDDLDWHDDNGFEDAETEDPAQVSAPSKPEASGDEDAGDRKK